MSPCDCLPDDWVSGLGCAQIPRINAAIESLSECLCETSCLHDEVAYTTQTEMGGTTSPTDNQLNLLFPNCVDCEDLASKIVYLIDNSGGIILFFFDVDTCTWIRVPQSNAIQNNYRTQSSNAYLSNSQSGNTAGLVLKLGPTVIWNATTFAPAVGDMLNANIWWGYGIDQFSDAVNPVDSIQFQLQFTGAFAHTVNLGTGAQRRFRNGLEVGNFSVGRLVTAASTDLALSIYADMSGTAPLGPQDWIWEIFLRQFNCQLHRITHV